MDGQTTCAACGEPVPQHLWGEGPEGRTPCEKCRATTRNHILKAEAGHFTLVGGDAKLTVARYSEVLLQTAHRLFDSGDYAVAVVVAHTACEVAVERIISQEFAGSSIPKVADPVAKLINGYNVSNDRVRSLFDALTGKDIEKDNNVIWEKFRKSAARRNLAVHKGVQPTQADTQESLTVVGEMVRYLVSLIR